MPLEQPQRDENGEVIPYDCHGINGNDGVIRRISEQQIVTDHDGRKRVSSLAFKPSRNGGKSVDLEQLILDADLDPREYVTSPRWIGSIRYTAQMLRDQGFLVGWDPLDENPYHGEVWGNFTRAKINRLCELAEWYVPIDGVYLNEAA